MKTKIVLLILSITILTYSCKKFDPEKYPLAVQINDFIWKGMNTYYLWQDEVPVLDDTRFKTEKELFEFLEGHAKPEVFFESLKYQPDEIDKWSWIVDDYEELEAYFSGIRKTSGAKFKFYLTAENATEVFGFVKYVVPGTEASSKPIERGDLFNSVNGELLTTTNYRDLIYKSTSFTLDLGTYFYNTTTETVEITANGEQVTLINEEHAENPIHKQTVFVEDAHKIGYVLYNSFTSNYDSQLNDAFQFLKGENITDLILDLRYNGGGSVRTAIYLSSMITGQFNGQIFTEEKWNPKAQQWLEENHPEYLVNHFTNTMTDGTALNTLSLDRVILITTGDSASASELVINALKPYIDVVTIGTKTHGKYVASTTLYDSPNFLKEGANPDHLWAMQPIILKQVNKLGDYAVNGFEPSIALKENPANMGVLGEETEPLTQRAIDYILTGSKFSTKKMSATPSFKNQLKSIHPFKNEMYIEKEIPFERF